jgi:hypothetical protein
MIVDVVDINSDCGKLRITIHCISDDAGASTGSKSEIALSENSQGNVCVLLHTGHRTTRLPQADHDPVIARSQESCNRNGVERTIRSAENSDCVLRPYSMRCQLRVRAGRAANVATPASRATSASASRHWSRSTCSLHSHSTYWLSGQWAGTSHASVRRSPRPWAGALKR